MILIEISNNTNNPNSSNNDMNNCKHLLSIYCVPGTVISAYVE